MRRVLRPVPIIVPTLSEYTFDAGKTAGCDTQIIEVLDDIQSGFTRTVNHGIKCALESERDYICILNDDAYPGDVDWLARMIEAMTGNIGLVGPSGLCRTMPQAYGVPHMSHAIQQVEQLAFFCVVIKIEVFASIGLLDEDFIHYGSDNDFVMRARKAGWASVWAPHVYVAHDHKASESKITREWKKHDQKILKKRWPSLVHSPVRGLRRTTGPDRRTARLALSRFQRQRVGN